MDSPHSTFVPPTVTVQRKITKDATSGSVVGVTDSRAKPDLGIDRPGGANPVEGCSGLPGLDVPFAHHGAAVEGKPCSLEWQPPLARKRAWFRILRLTIAVTGP